MKKLLLIVALVLSTVGMNAQQLIFPAAPPAPTVRFFGTTASTSYFYWTVARYPWGISAPSSSGSITNGSATLSSVNVINVAWAGIVSATGYDLLRTATNVAPTGACNCALVVNTTATSYNDIGNPLLTYTRATAGLIYPDATAQSTSAPGVGGTTTQQVASTNDTTYNLPVVTYTGVASAVNRVTVTNAATATQPSIAATGADSNVDLTLAAKGSGIVNVPGVVYSSSLTITTANLNTPASNTLVADVAGRTLTPVGFTMQALGGATATCTAVVLQDSAGVAIATEAAAGLVQNQIINEASAVANLTLGAGWNTALTAGKGITVVKTGAGCATATSFVFQIRYKIS